MRWGKVLLLLLQLSISGAWQNESLQHLEPDPARSSEPSRELLCLLCISWIIAVTSYLIEHMRVGIVGIFHCSACSLSDLRASFSIWPSLLCSWLVPSTTFFLSLPRTWVHWESVFLIGNLLFLCACMSHSLVYGICIYYCSAAYQSLPPGVWYTHCSNVLNQIHMCVCMCVYIC